MEIFPNGVGMMPRHSAWRDRKPPSENFENPGERGRPPKGSIDSSKPEERSSHDRDFLYSRNQMPLLLFPKGLSLRLESSFAKFFQSIFNHFRAFAECRINGETQ